MHVVAARSLNALYMQMMWVHLSRIIVSNQNQLERTRSHAITWEQETSPCRQEAHFEFTGKETKVWSTIRKFPLETYNYSEQGALKASSGKENALPDASLTAKTQATTVF